MTVTQNTGTTQKSELKSIGTMDKTASEWRRTYYAIGEMTLLSEIDALRAERR